MTQKILFFSTIFILCISSLSGAGAPPEKGETMPDINLPMPEDEAVQKYLGLSGKGHFTIPDIDAEVVIIEIFSMYCPHCQSAAETVNKFYELMENNAGLKDKMKLIGIGVGNTAFEVNVFRENYNIPFPLFEDTDFVIHKKLGEVLTPYFIGIKKYGDGSSKVFYSELGGFDDPEAFLKSMLELSELK